MVSPIQKKKLVIKLNSLGKQFNYNAIEWWCRIMTREFTDNNVTIKEISEYTRAKYNRYLKKHTDYGKGDRYLTIDFNELWNVLSRLKDIRTSIYYLYIRSFASKDKTFHESIANSSKVLEVSTSKIEISRKIIGITKGVFPELANPYQTSKYVVYRNSEFKTVCICTDGVYNRHCEKNRPKTTTELSRNFDDDFPSF